MQTKVLLLVKALTMLVLAGAALSPVQASEPPRVVATIAPIALIAAEIAGDAVNIEQLLPHQASAHDYALKVSDQRRLREADLVVWVGPALESFLAKSLRNIPAERVLALGALEGIHFPDRHSEHASHDTHDHGDQDLHIWLDPHNARVMGAALAQALIALAPESKDAITARAVAFDRDTAALQEELAAEFAPLGARGFVVYHPGYDHLVARFGLTQLDFVALTPEQKAGARHMAGLKQQLSQNAVCLFKEPYQKHARIDAWAAQTQLRTAVLYPLGRESHQRYRDLMEDIAAQMQSCLADSEKN